MASFERVDDYQAAQTEPGRSVLAELRRRVAQVAPDAEEVISYDMPTFAVDGRRLFHAAVWKAHLAIYPVPEATPDDPRLTDDLGGYLTGRGTLRLRYRDTIPWSLVDRVVRAHLHHGRT